MKSVASATRPIRAWAAISEDVPPEMYEIAFARSYLERKDLRHIQVTVTPIVRKRKRKVIAGGRK